MIRDENQPDILLTDVEVQYKKGLELLNEKKYSEAIECFDKVIAAVPKFAAAYDCRARANYLLSNYAESLIDCDKAVKYKPFQAIYFYHRALVLKRLGRAEAEISDYKKAIELDATKIEYFQACGKAYARLSDLEVAVSYFNDAIKLKPDNSDLFLDRGIIQFALMHYQKALIDLQQALQFEPTNPLYLTIQGVIKQKLADYKESKDLYLEAQAEYQKALESDPNYSYAAAKLAELQEFLGQFEMAMEGFNQVLEADTKVLQEKEQEATQQTKALEKRYSIKINTATRKELEEMKKQLEQIKNEHHALLTLLQIKQIKQTAEQEFKQHSGMWLFYRTINIKLEQIFIGCKTVASGFVDHQVKGPLGTIGSSISLVGKIVSLVPTISNFVAPIIDVVGSGVKGIDHTRQENILINIAELGSLKDIKKASESVALRLTQRYRRQLQLLNLPNGEPAEQESTKISFWSNVKKKGKQLIVKGKEHILKEAEKSDVQNVAEFAVLRILEALQNGKIDADKDFAQQFMEVIITNMTFSRLDRAQESLSVKLGMTKFKTQDGRIWNFRDFFHKPGLFISEDQYYVSTDSDPGLYDYCEGSLSEVQQRKLTPLPIFPANTNTKFEYASTLKQ
jgi:tetratricopeptide (TPR) repeat protein